MVPTECPHCEETFQIDPANVGKALKCPACKDVFIADAKGATGLANPEKVSELPEPRSVPSNSGAVSDFVPVIDIPVELPYEAVVESEPLVLSVDVPSAKRTVSKPTSKAAKAPKPDDIPTLAPKPDDIPTLAPKPVGPKVMTWDGDEPPVLTTKTASSRPAAKVTNDQPILDDDDEDDERLAARRKRRRRRWGKIAFFGILGAVMLTLALGSFGLWRYYQVSETREAEAAKLAFDESNFPLAQDLYSNLIKSYPESREIDRYKFFASLSTTHNALGGLMLRENPKPGIEAFQSFTSEHGQSPLAMPESGFGDEIVQLGRKLLDILADHAGDQLVSFQNERAKLEKLEDTAKAVKTGEELIPSVDKFRSKNAVSLDTQRQRFTELNTKIAAERHRLSVLAPFRDLSVDPTTPRIEEFEKVLVENKLTADAEAKQMLAAAEKRLRELLLPVSLSRPAVPVPQDLSPPVLFSSSLTGTGVLNPSGPMDVSFSVARGVLYALDTASGNLLWGTRIAAPTADLRSVDLPVRLTVADQEWVLVTSDLGGVPSLTARLARTGEAVWYQPLEIAPAGRPIVAGGRIYLPLRNTTGTIAEFETSTGLRTANLSIRQPIGAGLSLLPTDRPGGNLLVVPADVKRVFLWELGREDANGERLPPRCVRVMLTEHPRDTLRGEATVINPSDDNGPRYLVLTQTDGPMHMKLRAFPIPKPEEIITAGATVATESNDRATEIRVGGWSWFPAISDGEKVILASDSGAFYALGVNQLGNADAPIFTMPAPKGPTEQEGVSRSLVVKMEDDTFWVVLGGRLVKLRTAVDPMSGLRILASGSGTLVGEPLHRADYRANANIVVIVGRSAFSGSIQATGFDLTTGAVRWERRLGLSPAGPPFTRPQGEKIVVDEDGSVYRVQTDPEKRAASLVATNLAGPFEKAFDKTVPKANVVESEKIIWVFCAEAATSGRRLRLRTIRDGQVSPDKFLPLPDQLAGPPIALGESLLIPLVNGYIYRLRPEDTQLAVGPLWRGDGAAGELVCQLTRLDDEEFLATDGTRKIYRWNWPNTPEAKPKSKGTWELTTKILLPPVGIPKAGEPGWYVAVADVSSTVTLFDGEKPGPAIRRWRPVEGGSIPVGKPTFITVDSNLRLVYLIGARILLSIDPTKPDPVWTATSLVDKDLGDLMGVMLEAGKIVVTDPVGKVMLIEPKTGKILEEHTRPPSQPLPISGAILGLGNEAFLLNLDGTGSFTSKK
ncbi:MAG: PQQ-binding-like beta-propeller repeat protein [Fimbriiglobus sp.]